MKTVAEVVRRWPSLSAKAWVEAFIPKACASPSVLAVVAFGAAARTSRFTADIDLLIIYEHTKPKSDGRPIDVDIRWYERDKAESLIKEGQELLAWIVTHGEVLCERDGYWTKIREKWLGRMPFPSASVAEGRVERAWRLYGELSHMGDEDAAQEQRLVALTQEARAKLIKKGVYPASRPELPDQLRGIGEPIFAEKLEMTLLSREQASVSIPEGALVLPPPTLAERHEINELMRAVRSYTHPVTFKEGKKRYVGTVVFLQHGNRLFGFTAAHNIRDKFNIEDELAIHVRLNSTTERTQFNILSTHIHPKYDPDPITGISNFDLAILELESNPIMTAGDVEQLYTGAFGKLPDGEHKVMSYAFVWVVGYPSELVKPRGDHNVLCQTAFATQILEYSDDQLSLNYPDTGYQMPHDGVTCEVGKMTLTPKGYSGGGLWVINYKAGELFNPHRHIKLIGIETHWSKDSRLARCVPSKVVADFLKDCFPDL